MQWGRFGYVFLFGAAALGCGEDTSADNGATSSHAGGGGVGGGGVGASGPGSGASDSSGSGGTGGVATTGSGGRPSYPSCGETALGQAAARLAPGQSAQFTKNTLQLAQDIQWQVESIFWDPTRAELQYMGKPASSQSINHSHYVYSAQTDTWSTTGQSLFPGSGHIWNPTFDPENGDYWFRKYGEDELNWFDRSDGPNGTWKTTVSQTSPALNGGNSHFAAMGWHPNLFGPTRPGIFIWAVWHFFAYDLTNHTFSVLNPDNFPSGSPYLNRSAGQALYMAETDQLLCFAHDTGAGHPALLVEAGAGSSSDVFADQLVSLTGEPPIEVFGGGGDVNHGHVVQHPANPSRLLLLDEKGTSRVWASDDLGATWQLQSYQHPFQEMDNWSQGEYTTGSVIPCGVVVGMTSNDTGGETVIWKPE